VNLNDETLNIETLSTVTGHQETRQVKGLIWLCAASASLTLAFSGIFWSQVVIAEVYALNALFVAGLLYGAWQVGPSNQSWLVPALFSLVGLSLANHFSILLVVPRLIWTLRAERRWPLVVTTFLAFWVGLSIY